MPNPINAAKYKNSFSILEIIIFSALIMLVLVTAMGFMIRLMATNRHNMRTIIATHYVEELVEFLNGEQETNWETFQSYAEIGSGIEYCVNFQLNLSTTLQDIPKTAALSNGCEFEGVVGVSPSIYSRRFILKKDSDTTPTRVDATVNVEWKDEGILYSKQIQTAYLLWE